MAGWRWKLSLHTPRFAFFCSFSASLHRENSKANAKVITEKLNPSIENYQTSKIIKLIKKIIKLTKIIKLIKKIIKLTNL